MKAAEVCAGYLQSDILQWPESKYRVHQIQKDLDVLSCSNMCGHYMTYSFDLDLKPQVLSCLRATKLWRGKESLKVTFVFSSVLFLLQKILC